MRIRVLLIMVILAIGSLKAQEMEPPKGAVVATPTQNRVPYRFQYTLAELNGKERINARTFDILTTGRGEMQTSSHLPVVEGGESNLKVNQQFSFHDVGLNFNMDVMPLTASAINASALTITVISASTRSKTAFYMTPWGSPQSFQYSVFRKTGT